jgi:hypothetical protein
VGASAAFFASRAGDGRRLHRNGFRLGGGMGGTAAGAENRIAQQHDEAEYAEYAGNH